MLRGSECCLRLGDRAEDRRNGIFQGMVEIWYKVDLGGKTKYVEVISRALP